jgi:hypothetical protein
MDRPICPLCCNTLREGEQQICTPCFQNIKSSQQHNASISSHHPPSNQSLNPRQAAKPSSNPKPAANLKVIRAKAAASAQTSTGTHVHQLHTDKAKQAAAKKQASSNQMFGGHPEGLKPPPFTTKSGRVCSIGYMVIFKNNSFTRGLLRGTITVERTSEKLLEDTKEAMFKLWDHSISSTHYPPAPHRFSSNFFNLAKTGRARKPPAVLHDNETFAQYLDDTKGDPSLELIFLSDRYLNANPWLPHPDSLSSTLGQPKSTINKKQSKRKASQELTYEAQILDDEEYDDSDSDSDGHILSLDNLQPNGKKAKCAPLGSTKVTSPRITRNQVAILKGKQKTIDLTNSLTTTPPRQLQRAQSDVAIVPLTHVVPANQTSKF